MKVYKDEICLTLLLLGVLVSLLWGLESGQPVNQVAQYCEMVKLYKDSNGENGWPDYKNIYSKTCSS